MRNQKGFMQEVTDRHKPGLSPIPHHCSIVVLGQLVTERIGLENGIVLSLTS
jgi:hypothetical protein